MDAVIVDNDTLRAIGLRNLLETRFAIEAVISHEPERLDVDETTMFFVTAEAFASLPYFYVPRRERVVMIGNMAKAPLPVINPGNDEESLIEAIDRIVCRLTEAVKADRGTPLSEREREVLRLVAKGHINKQIAAELGISFNTVLTHRRNIMEKLGLRTVAALSLYAVMNGLISQNEL